MMLQWLFINGHGSMVRKDGHLVHIDFGHFLGNYKKFLMYRREKVDSVLILPIYRALLVSC